MASAPKYAKYLSTSIEIDEVISSIKDLYFGRSVAVDEKFLNELKSVLESKVPVATSDFELNETLSEEGLPIPNEMLTKIFGYLDIKDISHCAQVCKRFQGISEEIWYCWDKITIDSKEVPSEFITFILEKGIKDLQILNCKILPPKPKFTHPLKLKSLHIDELCSGYDGIITHLLKTHPMEKIQLERSKNLISNKKFSEFTGGLPKTGSRLKSLALAYFDLEGKSEYVHKGRHYDHIAESCVNLEELDIYDNELDPSSAEHLSENLTSSILRLSLFSVIQFDDNALCKLVKRCSKLQTLDIRDTKVTWHGLSASIENLQCLEYLAIPERFGEEFGLPNSMDMKTMQKLRSMKQLKMLLIGMRSIYNTHYKILFNGDKEKPRLIRPRPYKESLFNRPVEADEEYFLSARATEIGFKKVDFLAPFLCDDEEDEEVDSDSE